LTNTLAYYATELITAVKSFVILAPGSCIGHETSKHRYLRKPNTIVAVFTKLFFFVTYKWAE